MKISCTPISLSSAMRNGMSQDEYFSFIATAGAEGTDLMEPNAYPWFWTDFENQRKDVVKRLKSFGLALSGYAAGNKFAQLDPTAFDAQIAGVKKAIHEAAEFAAPCLRIFGGYHADCGGVEGIGISNGLSLVKKAIEQLLPEAEKWGVTLALENHGRLPGLSREVLSLLRYFNHPNFRTLIDFANFTAGNMDEIENPCEAYARLKDYVVHSHVKGFMPGPAGSGRIAAGCVAGEGRMVPLRQLFYMMQENNYQGFCSLEYEGNTWTPEAEGVPRSLKNLLEMKKSAMQL